MRFDGFLFSQNLFRILLCLGNDIGRIQNLPKKSIIL